MSFLRARYAINLPFIARAAVVCALFLVTQRGALAMEPPRTGEIATYRGNATFAARLSSATATVKNHLADPNRIARWSGTMNRRICVLPIDFTDAPQSGLNTPATLQTAFFGFGGTPPYDTLRSFYRRSSYNRLSLNGTVLPWFRASLTRASTTYSPTNPATVDFTKAEALILEALNYYASPAGGSVNFANFDNNFDGYIDCLCVVFAGPDSGWGGHWWGWAASSSNAALTSGGVKVRDYMWLPETLAGGAFDVKSAIHEFGNVMGLPDLYDYDDTGNLLVQGGVGGLDIMDREGDHNCFSKWLLGWLTPTGVTGIRDSGTFTLRPSDSNGDAVAVMQGFSPTNPLGEYFMVQNRRKNGNDANLPNSGLIIWHVDARTDINGNFLYNNSYNATAGAHKLVRLMEADGLEQIETASAFADAGDFYLPGKDFLTTTTPNSKDYALVDRNIIVNQISTGVSDMSCFVSAGWGPDMEVRISSNPVFSGDNTYQQTPSGVQVVTQSVGIFQPASYFMQITNEDTLAHSYVLRSSDGSGGGWTVSMTYNFTDITSQVTGSGYTLPLANGATALIQVTVTPDGTVTNLDTKRVAIRSYMDSTDPTVRDVVAGDTTLDKKDQPDLLVKTASGADPLELTSVYQQTPSGNQIKGLVIRSGATAVFNVRVVNDGTLAGSFTLRAVEGAATGWTTVYKKDGVTDVTTPMKLGTYTTASLAVGAFEDFTVEMTASAAAVGGVAMQTDISAYRSATPSTKSDSVRCIADVDQPDLLVRLTSEPDTAYATNDVYQSVPSGGQVRAVTVDSNVTMSYTVKVQNDSIGARALVLKAVESPEANWVVAYQKADGSDITALMRGAGYTTASLASGGTEVITVTVKATSFVTPNTSKAVTVTSHMDSLDATVRDAVQVVTTVRDTIQADLLVKKASEADTAFAIVDTYQLTASGAQIEPQLLRLTGRTTSKVRLVNNGNQAHAFVLRGVDGRTPGWVTTVYLADGTNITQAIRSVGYTTGSIAAGASETYTVEMTPDSTAAPIQAQTFTFSAYSSGTDSTPGDVVQISSSVDRADLLVRLGSETDAALGLDNVYQSAPTGLQVRTQDVDMNTAGVYRIKVQNDGASSQVLLLKAAESAETGWSIAYRKSDGSDITAQMLGAGYSTTNLASGASEVIAVEMTPGNTVAGGTSKTTTVRVYLPGDLNTAGDAVQATTTVKSVIQPDLLIKTAAEPDTAFAIANTYQQSPAGAQVKRLDTQTGVAAVYQVRVSNAGNLPRSFAVRMAEDAATGWTVVCKRADGADITREIKQTGFITSTLAAAGSETLTIEATPDGTVGGGEAKAVTLSLFTNLGDPKAQDMVRCISTLGVITQPDLALQVGVDPAAPFLGDTIYQGTPSGDQLSATPLAVQGTATYRLKITNRGNTTRAFVLKAAESSETGWTITYRSVGADVADAVRGLGFAVPALAPGATTTVDVTMTPAASVGGSTSKSTTLSITLDGADTVVRDSVKLIATVSALDQADLQVKLEGETESGYATPGLHQATPDADQTKSQSVLPNGTGIFYVKLANDGNTERTFLLKVAETAGADWAFSYRNGTLDITDAVHGDGYATAKLAKKETRVLTIGVTPGSSATGNASTILSVLADGATTDSIRAVALLNHTPDVPEMLSPAEGGIVLPAPTFSFRGTDPDADSMTYQIVVKPAAGGVETLFNAGSGLSGADVTFTVPETQALAAGAWTWQVRATDSRGAASVLSPARSFVANRPPAVPTVLSPAVGGVALPSLTFQGKAADADGDTVRLVVETSFGGRTQTMTSDVVAPGVAVSVVPAAGTALATGSGTWRVKAIDSRGAESAWSAAMPLTVLSTSPQSMKMAGLTSFGLPARPGAALPSDFGLPASGLYVFDAATQKFIESPSSIELGRGYFVRSSSALPLRFSGTPVNEPFAVALKPGWNLVSSPFTGSLTWDMEKVLVRGGGVEKTLAAAVASGWLSDYVWGWKPDPANPGSGYYEMLYDSWVLNGMNDQLEPWRAYWIHSTMECELVLPVPSARSRGGARAADAQKHGWSLRLLGTSRAGGGAVVIGSTDTARAMSIGVPPDLSVGGAGIRVSLESANGPAALDVRARGDVRQTWNLVVTPQGGTAQGEEVTLTWPDLRALPKDVTLTLTDPATGARRSLRSSGGYTFGLAGGARRLEITAEPRANVPVLVSGVEVTPVRSDSRAVRFTLSRAAAVDVEVLSPTGRTVGVVTRSYTGGTGMNQVLWSGSAAPGVYLVRVTATGEDGTRAQAMRMVVIAR